MTETAATTSAIDGAFVPHGRPVARFVVPIAAVAGVLTIIWATGLVNPRVTASTERGIGSGGGVAVLSVHNEGLFPAHARVVDTADRFVRLAAPSPAVRLGRGATVRIRLPYVVDCRRYEAAKRTYEGASEPLLIFVVEVRGAVGSRDRRIWTQGDDLALGDACPSG